MNVSVPRGSLRTFLETAKNSLHNAILNQQRVTLVIGNESADLDSITSAIVLAYVRSNSLSTTPLTNPSVNKHTPPSQYPPLYIPLLNIPKADVKIRPELLKLLPYANLEPNHLITLDDLSIIPPTGLDPTNRETLQPKLTRLLLTDHNKLAGPLATKFSDQVIGCIDHHVDEHIIPDPPPKNEPRIIAKVGSCTSLVIQYCRPLWDNISQSSSSASSNAPSLAQDDSANSVYGIDDLSLSLKWDAQIAYLALASILIDTHCLQDTTKTVDTDIQAVSYLESKIKLALARPGKNPERNKYDRQQFFNEISTAKKDLSSLSLEEVLRKDYKEWDRIDVADTKPSGEKSNDDSSSLITLGISSVVQSLKWQILEKSPSRSVDSFLQVIRQFSRDRGLDLYTIMTTSTDSDSGEFKRELLLMATDDDVGGSDEREENRIVQRFAEKFGGELGLKEWSEVEGLVDGGDDEKGKLRVWWIEKTENSRKQVAPMLRSAIENPE